MSKHTIDLREMTVFHEEMPMGAGAPDLEHPVIDGIVAGETEVEMPEWVKNRLKQASKYTAAGIIALLVLSNISLTRVLSKSQPIDRTSSVPTTLSGTQRSITSSHTAPPNTTDAPKTSADEVGLPTRGVGGGGPIIAATPAMSPLPSPTPTPTPSPEPSPSPTPSPEPSPEPTPEPSPEPTP